MLNQVYLLYSFSATQINLLNLHDKDYYSLIRKTLSNPCWYTITFLIFHHHLETAPSVCKGVLYLNYNTKVKRQSE